MKDIKNDTHHKFDVSRLNRLERPERYALYRPEELLKEAGLQSGMIGVDIGCGTGFFTSKAAQLVGSAGRVYALDIETPMLDYVANRNLGEHVHLLKNEESSFPLPDDVADFAIMGLVLHEAVDKMAFLKEAVRVLKKGGILVGLEWKKLDEEKGPEFHVRLSQIETQNYLKKVGFENIAITDWTDSHYTFKCSKK